MIEINNRWTGKVIRTVQSDTLRGADLRDADLRGADLGGAKLGGAYLVGAYLVGAYLSGADLRDADLGGADLGGAKLGGAKLGGAKLPDGRTLEEYRSWLPEGLLVQGGKSLSEVVESWDSHDWSGCPMHAAFGAKSLADVPECWRSAAATFVALFDGNHLPKPEVTA